MISFIPFPRHTNSIPDPLWADANQVWTAQLNILLDASDQEFSGEWLNNTKLCALVASILDIQMDKNRIDPALSRSVFVLYVRAASLLANNHIDLATSPLFSSGQLCSFAAVYHSSNPTVVRQIFSNLLDNSPLIHRAISESLVLLTDCLAGVPEAIASQPKAHALERSFVVSRLLDVLVSSTLNVDNLERNIIEQKILECHGNIGALSKTVSVESKEHPFFYHLKYGLVSTFNSLMDRLFFLPLGFVTDTCDPSQLVACKGQLEDKDEIVDRWSKHILDIIEKDGLEDGKSAFEDAPMIMDWEVAFSITRKLEIVNKSLWNGEDDRIEFLKMSMEQVRDTIRGIPHWHRVASNKIAKNKLPKTIRKDRIEPAVDSGVEYMSKISQVLDVFPDLGEGFIEACLEANQNDPEQVVMQLLEDNLPPHLAGLDRSLKRQPIDAAGQEQEPDDIDDYENESVLNSRRNIFDNDEFDMLRHSVDKSKVHLGKKADVTAKSVMDDKSFVDSEKSNLLKRVVNMYEDDYDDTYDDVDYAGGAVDSGAVEDNEDVIKPKKESVDPNILNESDLVHWFTSDPESLSRSPVVRRSAKRANMREKTGMTDEQLEGWAVMFARNPRKQRILDKYALFDGSQTEVAPQVSEAQKKEQSKNKNDNRPPPTEAKDRSYKAKNKARFANHNRKKMSDKKFVRAGVSGPTD
ncbi:hypothetical protein CLU79DRAFT_722889 [Phycomyces nitens]|nr:hypothetical protein CLU79DRAFT_722889 [Phycomyces nitens]